MIIPIYKPLGASTHQLAQRIGELHQTKATHTGTLDPLAEGVVVVLTGEDRFHKLQYSNWKKTYQFEITFGLSTDSHDLLGKITEQTDKLPDLPILNQQLKDWFQRHQGTTLQTVPAFSARRLAGKSSFQLAKSKQAIPPKQEQITLFSSVIEDQQYQNMAAVSQTALDAIAQVTGSFRQTELEAQWQQLAADQQLLPNFTITVTTSKRTYIRGLVRDIGNDLGFPAVTSRLIRTKNGPYSIPDCICLV